jgi:hypothetical protein
MQAWDIRWSQDLEEYSTDYTNSRGEVVSRARTYTFEDLGSGYIENIHTWVFFQIGSWKTVNAPERRSLKRSTGITFFGINYNERGDEPESSPRATLNGYRLKIGSSYYAPGWTEGPYYDNGISAFYARVKSFQIRKHGSGDAWQSFDPGTGLDADGLP